MRNYTTIELFKENFKFSSGHFTIFSQHERENLHGHNFQVQVRFTAEISADGISFDYRTLKTRVETLCRQLNEHFLLPGRSPYLDITESGDYVYAVFNREKIPFLKRDVLILPIANITLEELSRWFLEQFLEDQTRLNDDGVHRIEVKVYSGPGQSASAFWQRAPRQSNPKQNESEN